MGKGDKKSKRGKIAKGTYGARRQKKKKSEVHDVAMNPPKAASKPAKKTSTTAKKTSTKKKSTAKEEK